MKSKKTILTILLNIVFCAALLWFFSRNAILRPFLGSWTKECLSGLMLLAILYANYYVFYPKLYRNNFFSYWVVVVVASLVTGIIEFVLGHSFIVKANPGLINQFGYYQFIFPHLLYVFCRNLAFNFFPFVFRERQQMQDALDKEVRIVYQEVRKLDVVDEQNNIQLVPIEDIFYCQQQRNFTEFRTVQNIKYTRLGSMKHLEQLFGDDFVRITPTVLVPLQHIGSCEGNRVVMKKRPWEETPTTFQLEPKTKDQVAEKIAAAIQEYSAVEGDDAVPQKPKRHKTERKPATPPQEKVLEVLSCIKEHPNCNTADIIAATGFSLSTVERCISELKKQGRIKHSGSRKLGGYYVVESGELSYDYDYELNV